MINIDNCINFPYNYCYKCKLYEKCKKICNPSIELTLKGLELQMKNNLGSILDQNDSVLFDTIINDQTDDNIVYDNSNGEFIIKNPGNYFINGWINIDGSEMTSIVQISIEVNDISKCLGIMNIITGQLYFNGYITTTDTNSIISIKNISEQKISIGEVPIQAEISIVYIG